MYNFIYKATVLSTNENYDQVQNQLMNSEQARRSLRQTVNKITTEIENIRSIHKINQETSLLWDSKNKSNIALRLKYETLMIKNQELVKQLYDYEFGDLMQNVSKKGGRNGVKKTLTLKDKGGLMTPN